MGEKNEVKLTLSQLLSLYTGGRPVGVRDYGEQYQDFFTHYGILMYINLNNFTGKTRKQAEELNFKSMLESIDLQYPALKKSKEFRALCKLYAFMRNGCRCHIHS